jgi:predicted nucleic acid-binding protein
MKIKVFLDTNILLDILQGGRAQTENSRIIFQAIWDGKIEAVLSTQSMIDASYLVQKAGMQSAFFNTATQCCKHINIGEIDSFHILSACKNYSGDFEDDAQVALAMDSFCDVFVTSDKKLLSRQAGRPGHQQFLTPEQFVVKMTTHKE